MLPSCCETVISSSCGTAGHALRRPGSEVTAGSACSGAAVRKVCVLLIALPLSTHDCADDCGTSFVAALCSFQSMLHRSEFSWTCVGRPAFCCKQPWVEEHSDLQQHAILSMSPPLCTAQISLRMSTFASSACLTALARCWRRFFFWFFVRGAAAGTAGAADFVIACTRPQE